MSAQYEFTAEEESSGYWLYGVQTLDQGMVAGRHQIRLAWADYDLWVPDGSIEPARVADALVRYLLASEYFQPIPAKVDSSHPRRMDQNADKAIMALIRSNEH